MGLLGKLWGQQGEVTPATTDEPKFVRRIKGAAQPAVTSLTPTTGEAQPATQKEIKKAIEESRVPKQGGTGKRKRNK